MSKNKTTLPIKGMHCRSCEIVIVDELTKIPGVVKAEASLSKKEVTVICDSEVSKKKLKKAIAKAGYSVGVEATLPWITREAAVINNFLGVMLLISFLYLAYVFLGLDGLLIRERLAPTSFLMIFVIGLTAGVSTCMAVVGGLVLGLSTRFNKANPEMSTSQKLRPHFWFNLGRLMGFFILGGVLGVVGGVLSPSPFFVGFFSILTALVMLFLGAQLTGLFPRLSQFSLTLPSSLSRRLGVGRMGEYSDKSAAFAGAISFFLPCGFTQSMQLLAVGTGSFLFGGLTMAVFALGTMPGLLGIGGLSAFFKGRAAASFYTFAGVMVIVFSLFNFRNGLNLIGLRPASLLSSQVRGVEATEGEAKTVEAVYTERGLEPWSINVTAGAKTKLVIDVLADGVGCMTSMTLPSLDRQLLPVRRGMKLEYNFTANPGEHLITCSMGMLHGKIVAI